jgi:hypothetical protein
MHPEQIKKGKPKKVEDRGRFQTVSRVLCEFSFSWMINLKENGQPGSDHSKTILLAEHVDQSDMKHVRLSVAR